MKRIVKTSIGRPRKRSRSILILITLALGFLAVVPRTQALTPAPDGGYPGGNTAEGQTALLSLTTGGFNTAVGFLSLRSATTGGLNTAIGAGTLLANTGAENTAAGDAALLSNTTASGNTAVGGFALFSNTTAAPWATSRGTMWVPMWLSVSRRSRVTPLRAPTLLWVTRPCAAIPLDSMVRNWEPIRL